MRILITGANRGIGLEYTKQYLSRGDEVVATYRNPNNTGDLLKLKEVHGDKLILVKMDVSDVSSIKKAHTEVAEKITSLDLIINNAAINSGDESGKEFKFGDFHKENILHVFNINIVGPLLVSEQFVDFLEKGTRSKIINISSGMGCIGEKIGYSYYSYSISKAAINMASKLLSNDLASRGIGVWSLDPGWNRTRMGGPNATSDPKDTVASMLKVIDSKSIKDSGKFLVWDGSESPW